MLEGILCQSLLPRGDGKGRAMCMEIMVPNAAIRNLIREDKIHQIYSAMQSGQDKFGMQTFNQSLATAYFQKQITMETALARSSNQDELQEMISRGASCCRNRAGTGQGGRTRQALGGRGQIDEFAQEKLTCQFLHFPERTQPGEKVSGERTAANKETLVTQLRRERITPGPIREKGKEFALPTFGSGSVKTKDIAIFFRQFSVMIDAGLPLVQCLEILAANQENPSFQKTLTGVRTTVEGGATLANAMKQFPKIFDDLTVNMIEAGETGGILDIILQRLAIYVEKAVRLRAAVKSALVYPVAVVSLAFLIVGALLKWVVPIFANLFIGLGVALPLPTRIVMGLSAFVGQFWWFFFIGGAGLVFGVKQIRKDPRGRYALTTCC